jgi:hypothetical protein
MPTTDPEHGQVRPEGCIEQGELEVVALLVRFVGLGVRRGAVTRRVDVAAAGKDEPGATLQGRAGLVKVYGLEACIADAAPVVLASGPG